MVFKLEEEENLQFSNCTACSSVQPRSSFYLFETEDEVIYDHFMWTLTNAPGLPRYGADPSDEKAPQTQPLAGQRPAEHDDHPVGKVPQTRTLGRQRSIRPRPEWAPDCPFIVQSEFSVPGVLCTSQYTCQWDDCQFSANRDSETFNDCKAYQQSVYNHIKEHVEYIDTPSSCQWSGCSTKLQPGRKNERNRIRHFTTHISWYYLCPNCGVFRARPDAQQGTTTCLTGSCKASDETIALSLAEARAKYGNLSDRFTIQGLCSIVLKLKFVV